MTGFWTNALAGVAGGVLTGCGIGGGTVLLIYMNMFTDLPLYAARGINLAYFLPTAGGALYGHIRNGLVDKRAFFLAGGAGVLVSVVTAWLAGGVDEGIGRKIFGAFLILVGLREIFRKNKKSPEKRHTP